MTLAKSSGSNGRLLSEALYLGSFACYVIFFYLQTTAFTMNVPGAVYSVVRGLLCFSALYRLYLYRDEIEVPTAACVALFAGLGLFYYIARADAIVLDAALLTAGAFKVSFKRIGIIYLFTGTFISLLALVCSQTGIIPDYTFLTNYGEEESVRHSLGIIYPTDCFAHVFYLVCTYLLLRWKKVTYVEIIAAGVLFAVLFKLTSARADMAGAVLMLVSVLLIKVLSRKNIDLPSMIKTVVSWVTMPVCAVIIFVVTYLYDPNNAFMYKLDFLMSYRLSLGKTGMNLYGYKLLGAPNFAENGNANGGVRDYTYVFYDSAYIKYLFKYGIVLLAVLFVIYALIGLRLKREKMFYGMVFILVIAMSLVIEHHMLELSYNITLLLLTADISTILHQDTSIYINNKNGIMSEA